MHAVHESFPVYVVEDNPSVAKSLCALLSAHGFRTTAFRVAPWPSWPTAWAARAAGARRPIRSS